MEVIRLKEMSGILHCFNGVWTDFVLLLMDLVSMKPYEEMRYSSYQLVSRISSIICILEEFWRTNLLHTCFCVMVFCWDLQGESTEEWSMLVANGWVTCSHAELCKKLWFYWFSV